MIKWRPKTATNCGDEHSIRSLPEAVLKLGRAKEDDDLIAGDAATRYRTESGSDRIIDSTDAKDTSERRLSAGIRSLPLSVLYRVAIEFIFSFTRLSFHTASTARVP